MKFPENLHKKLLNRTQSNMLRELKSIPINAVDFCSNDYLGLGNVCFESKEKNTSTGSRLISGTSEAHLNCEAYLAKQLKAEACLLFNSGYAANTGLLSAVLGKDDLVIYDKHCHASIREGITLSNAKSYGFDHNSVESLEQKLQLSNKQTFVVVESHYSMEGDVCPLNKIANLCKKYGAYLIVDEAHSLAWYGNNGLGLSLDENLEEDIFARVYTFGKGLGYHGAVIAGSQELIKYLINFSRPFIYTTALAPKDAEQIQHKFAHMLGMQIERTSLQENIQHFKTAAAHFSTKLIASNSPIQAVILGDNTKCDKLQNILLQKDFYLKGIKYPTVAKGSERLRIILHSYNTKEEISELCSIIQKAL